MSLCAERGAAEELLPIDKSAHLVIPQEAEHSKSMNALLCHGIRVAGRQSCSYALEETEYC